MPVNVFLVKDMLIMIVRIRRVSVCENSTIWDDLRNTIFQPKCPIRSRPGIDSIPIKSVYCNNTIPGQILKGEKLLNLVVTCFPYIEQTKASDSRSHRG